MDFPFLLAEGKLTLADRLFALYPPIVAIPVFVVGMVLIAIVVERVSVFVLRRISKNTDTHVDDAIAEGLPSVMRPAFVLVGLHAVVNAVFRVEVAIPEAQGGGTELQLTPMGKSLSPWLFAVTALVLAFCVTRLALKIADAWVSDDAARAPIGPPLKFAIKVVMVPVGVLAAAEAGGVQLTSLLTALSVGSLAVGLALQDTLKNVIAGVQIVIDRPIRVGDYVEVEKNVRGTVLEIGLRSTKLKSPDNNTIIIPNGTIANAIVTNLDYGDRSYLQTFQIAVAYGSDTRRVQTILEEVALQAAKEMAAIAEATPKVSLRELGESGVNFTVDVTFRQWAGRLPLVTELYHRFYDRLRAEGVEIPFPTRTVILRQETPLTARE
jgi:small-conductance mechanosensitive channel